MKNLLTFALLITSLGICAQTGLGVRAGLNFANQKFTSDGIDISPNMKMGAQFGLVYGVKVAENVTLRPGLLYSAKGTKLTQQLFNEEIEVSNSFNYLELPLDIVYRSNSILLNVGPYLGYGLSASSTVGDTSEKVDWEEDDVNRISIGLNLGIGYQISSTFSLNLSYGTDLTNLAKNSDDLSVKNTCLAIFGIYSF